MGILLNKSYLNIFKMKPIKLNDMPEDPCYECLVKAVCNTACSEKRKQIDWINSKFYGCEVTERGRRRKNASVIIKLREQNRKFDKNHPGYVHPDYRK